jgi:glycosyltransferase involved in cell wall biosynthesis
MEHADQRAATPAPRPQLLFLGHGAERTGPPILLAHLLRGLAADGRYDLTVLSARSGPLLAEYAAAPAATLSVGPGREPMAGAAAVLRRVGAERAIAPLQDRIRRRTAGRAPAPDLVYVNGATPPTAALLRALALPAATPVILHVHEMDVGLRTNLSDDDRSLLFARADRVIAVSDAVRHLLIDGHHLDPATVSTCAGFIDIGALEPTTAAAARSKIGVPAEATVIGSLGLADWRKDPDHLLRAVHALRATRPELDPWVVWIGGDPESADGLRCADEARRLGLADRFRHVAHQDRPDHLLRALDVFALPAREDAFPLAALEAAAVGLPLVCFRTGGIAALCDHGAGVAVDYPDTSAFAAALASLLDDGAHRARVGARARELVATDHDTPAGVERITAVIESCLATRP